MSKGGRYMKQPEKKGKGGKVLLIVISVLLVLLIGGIIAGVLAYNGILGKITRAEVLDNSLSDEEIQAMLNYNPDAPSGATLVYTEPAEEPTTVPTTLPYIESNMDIVNILVVGQAARAGEEHHMADTMILMTVNKESKTLTLTSFLRDAYVDLPDYKGHKCGNQRINVCYNLGYGWGGSGGAMEMMNMCLYNNFGIDVDYNIEIDFEAFINIVDWLGGVEVDLTEAEAKYLNEDDLYVKTDVEPGVTTLDGMAALSYARMRKAEGDGDSDIKRTGRQRQLIQTLLKKFNNMSIADVTELIDGLLPKVITNMTNDEITTCLWEILPILPELTIETGTCPVETTYWGELIELGGYPSSVLKFDAGQNRRLMRAITEGTEE